MTLFLHLARRAAVAFAGSLAAVVALFLVVDFAENVAVYHGPGWISAVLALYLARTVVVTYQTAPAAMLLAAAVTASGLRRTQEYTAMRALGLGPARVVVPVLAVAVLVAGGLMWAGDSAVVEANARVDRIMAECFRRGGYARGTERKRWFRGRGGHRIYHLRGGGEGGEFDGVTVLDVTPGFRLARRLDAARMVPGASPGAWILEDVAERTFKADGTMTLATYPRRVYAFDEDPAAFAVRPGRPSQMRRSVLRAQANLRRRLGLGAQDFMLEWNGRFANPMAGIAAALLALGLALRRERKGHLTAAIVEAVSVSLSFWVVQGLFWSLGASGHLPPVAGAWGPDVLFLAAGGWAVRRLA